MIVTMGQVAGIILYGVCSLCAAYFSSCTYNWEEGEVVLQF